MAESKYTAPNDFRAFCEMLGETETSMAHHGIKGQKHGLRRFQYEDGSLTPAGKERYGVKSLRKKAINEAKTQKELDTKEKENVERRFYKAAKLGAAGLGIGFISKRIRARGALGMIAGEGSSAGNLARVSVGTLGRTAALGAGVVATNLTAKGGMSQHNIKMRRLELSEKSKKNKAIDAVVKAERKAPKAKTPWNENPTPNTTWDEKPRKTRHNI